MSLIEIVQAPTGRQYCVEAHAAGSMGGRLRRTEDPGGPWAIEVYAWPPFSWRVLHVGTAPSREDAERRLHRLAASIARTAHGAPAPGSLLRSATDAAGAVSPLGAQRQTLGSRRPWKYIRWARDQ